MCNAAKKPKSHPAVARQVIRLLLDPIVLGDPGPAPERRDLTPGERAAVDAALLKWESKARLVQPGQSGSA